MSNLVTFQVSVGTTTVLMSPRTADKASSVDVARGIEIERHIVLS